MENIHIQRMPDGITKISGVNRGIPFDAAINPTKTGGVITYHKSTGDKMEALGKFALGELLIEIEKKTVNNVNDTMMDALSPFTNGL